jgi:hypothetical protein
VGQHLGVVVDARDLVIERKEVAVTRPVPQPSSRIGEPGGTAAWMSAASSCPGSLIVNWSGCFWKVGVAISGLMSERLKAINSVESTALAQHLAECHYE